MTREEWLEISNPYGKRATIPQAFDDLTTKTFSLYVRMMVMSDKELSQGVTKMAKKLGMCENSIRARLDELKLKGYIRYVRPDMVGMPVKIEISRRLHISGPNHFVRLSNHLTAKNVHDRATHHSAAQENTQFSGSVYIPPSKKRAAAEILGIDVDDVDNLMIFCGPKKGDGSFKNPPDGENVSKNGENGLFYELGEVELDIGGNIVTSVIGLHDIERHNREHSREVKKLQAYAKHGPALAQNTPPSDEENQKCFRDNDDMLLNMLTKKENAKKVKTHQNCEKNHSKNEETVIDREALLSKKGKQKSVDNITREHVVENTKNERKETALSSKISNKYLANKKSKKRGGSKGGQDSAAAQQLDWNKLDQDLRGSPVVSFSMGVKKRSKIIEVLERKPRDAQRKALLKKLASEFGRIYARYRRMLQKSKGHIPSYTLPAKERDRYAGEAAMWCIYKEVTPRQVLEYWAENIKNFADGTMKQVPLAFLSSPANIDKVACSIFNDDEKKIEPRNTAPKKKKGGKVLHSFSETHRLHKELRRALEQQGFELVRQYTDRHLMSVQVAALDIVSGHDIVVLGEYGEMVRWAAENFYKKEDVRKLLGLDE